MREATSSSLPLTSAQTTLAPSAVKSSAMALPMPEPAPVMTAILFASRDPIRLLLPAVCHPDSEGALSRQLKPRRYRYISKQSLWLGDSMIELYGSGSPN